MAAVGPIKQSRKRKTENEEVVLYPCATTRAVGAAAYPVHNSVGIESGSGCLRVQRVMDAYTALVGQCILRLRSEAEDNIDDGNVPTLTTLIADYRAILELLDIATTKFALALKPPVSTKDLDALIPDLTLQVNPYFIVICCFIS